MGCQVKLKEKRNVIEFDLRNVNAKKHKETKKACISFGSIIFVKKYNLPLLQSNSKTLNKKKKIMVMVVMVVKWNGGKTEVVIFNKTNSFWFTPEAKRETTLSDRCSEILRNHNWQEPYLVLSDKQCSW